MTRLQQRLRGELLLCEPLWLSRILAFDAPDETKESEPEPEPVGYEVVSGVAVVSISGFMMRNGPDWLRDWLDITYTDETRYSLQQAEHDPNVRSILLDINSPGGIVGGTKELADLTASLSKRVVAQITDLGASAAYWVASQADEVVANETALVGSIGVFNVLLDAKGSYEADGYKVHVISSGPNKGGHPGAGISDEKLVEYQDVINSLATLFFGAIETKRGISDEIKTGKVWVAEGAKALGLLDRLGTFEATLAKEAERNEREMNEEELQKAQAAFETERAKFAAERAAFEAAKQAQIEAEKATLINHAAAEGRVLPAARASIEAYGKAASVEDLKVFLASLPVAVSPIAIGAEPKQGGQGQSAGPINKVDRAYSDHSPAFMDAASQIRAYQPDGKAIMKDGSVRDARDFKDL